MVRASSFHPLLAIAALAVVAVGCGTEIERGSAVGSEAVGPWRAQTIDGQKEQCTTLGDHRFRYNEIRGRGTYESVSVERGYLAGTVTEPDALPRETKPVDFVEVSVLEEDTGVVYRITAVKGPNATRTVNGKEVLIDESGQTYAYTLEPEGSGPPLCGAFGAIPIAAIWDKWGYRVESTEQFTFACLDQAIAKCYAWGYRPWRDDPVPADEMRDIHQACTRMATADYRGRRETHTKDGTDIYRWDVLSIPILPASVDSDADSKLGQLEAIWDKNGALCMNHLRWTDLPVDGKALPSCAGFAVPADVHPLFNRSEIQPLQAMLYEHNFSGRVMALGPGRYNYDAVAGQLVNDVLSTLRVPSGWTVTLYEDEFSGRSKSFTAGDYYVGDDFNDVTSSIVMEPMP